MCLLFAFTTAYSKEKYYVSEIFMACPLVGEWIKNMWYNIYIHNGIFPAMKKNEIFLFVAIWMYQEGVMLSEISEAETDK